MTNLNRDDVEIKFCVPCNKGNRMHVRGNCVACQARPQDVARV